MKHLRAFESYSDEDLKVFQELYDMNPNNKEHDLFAFVARTEFVEEDDGRFKKTLGIEKMIKITRDRQGMSNIQGLQMRGNFDPELKYYQIWLPKDISDMVEDKGYQDIEPYILDAIADRLKIKQPRQTLTNLDDLRTNVKDQMNQMDKYNL